jgi:MoaA/NifB/PqqE/SkfB family radical SAM enzyme
MIPRVVAQRCRHVFETVCVHANGEVVCSIIDGRGDFVVGNVHEQSIREIFDGPRYRELRRLVLSTADHYCPAIGKRCPLKTIPVFEGAPDIPHEIRYIQIEPTSACDLRCLSCPVRDFSSDTTWRDAYHDGGVSFLAWDGLRRSKQHAADVLLRIAPGLATRPREKQGRLEAALLRGRIKKERRGTLPIDVLKKVVSDLPPSLERVDFYNYGEPFLYYRLVEALRHVRACLPGSGIAISTDGMQVRETVEDVLIGERLVDWIIFSIDGSDADTYARYRIGGTFETAFRNLVRFHRKAAGTGIHVMWQYVVFRWNDRDEHLRRAIAIAEEYGITLWFDFSRTWGRSRRVAGELSYLVPYLKPETGLPRQPGHYWP